LSPVADLKVDRPVKAFDLYSQIPQRAIAAEPERVAAVVLAYARGLESQGVLAAGKHFPGLGPVAEDTHFFAARVQTRISDFEGRDWLPFRALTEGSNALLMPAHVQLAGVDLLLVAWDGEKSYDVLYALLAADKEVRLDKELLEASRKRFGAVTGKVFTGITECR
jgi:beta-glucosidase-like glycosyl hydrolase